MKEIHELSQCNNLATGWSITSSFPGRCWDFSDRIVFWDVTHCSPYMLIMLQRNLQSATSHYTVMEAGSFCKPSVPIDQTTRHYTPEGCNLHIHCHDKLNPLWFLFTRLTLGPNQPSTQWKTRDSFQGDTVTWWLKPVAHIHLYPRIWMREVTPPLRHTFP